MRVVDNEYKLAKYIKIAMLFLEDDDAISAETYIKKASALLSTCKVRVLVQFVAPGHLSGIVLLPHSGTRLNRAAVRLELLRLFPAKN